MKERPILMSAPMVRALLAGTKTQTRRVVKPAPPANTVAMGRWQDPGPEPAYWAFLRDGPVDNDHPFGGAELHGESWRCPYGQPGDQVWLREAWRTTKQWDHLPPRELEGVPLWFEADLSAADESNVFIGKLRPGMFMPRWASRITLEVTGVRVERLQDISEADAIAEGAFQTDGGWWKHDPDDHISGNDPVESYRRLWEHINGPGSWDANPWVWVVEFRRLP